ncbi:hypothetical protein GOODEAATRI_012188, partial [Goodea atripinnis]
NKVKKKCIETNNSTIIISVPAPHSENTVCSFDLCQTDAFLHFSKQSKTNKQITYFYVKHLTVTCFYFVFFMQQPLLMLHKTRTKVCEIQVCRFFFSDRSVLLHTLG